MTRNRKIMVAGGLVAAVAVGGGVAIAGGGDSDERVTGPEADRAARAAVDAVGGGRVTGVEREDDGRGAWEVEVVRRDGRQVEVHLDGRLRSIGVEGDDDGAGDQDEGEGEDDDGSEAGAASFTEPRRIDNPYLPLTAFRTCELRGREDGASVRVVRRLLPRTERFRIGGRTVEAAVVEDRDYEDGALVERTLDYFAQADDGTVHYLGEDVDDYEDGRVVGHHGAWRYGRGDAKLGVAMPARPRVGARWRFEDVPGVTVESDEVVGRLERVTVRGVGYRDVIRVRESIRPEGDTEHKLYARGIGVIRELPPEGRVELVRCR